MRCSQDRFAFLGEAGASQLNFGERRGRFVAFRLRLGQNPLRRGAALLDHGRDRTPEESPEQPDQDDDVDGLDAERPPVDGHGIISAVGWRTAEAARSPGNRLPWSRSWPGRRTACARWYLRLPAGG